MEIDLSRLPARVQQQMDEIFRKDFDLKVLKAVQRQQQAAAAARDKMQWREDMRPQHAIDPFIDSIWRTCYGHNYTENPDLMRFLAKRNEEIALRPKSNKIMVGYTGRTGRCGRVKFDRGTINFAT